MKSPWVTRSSRSRCRDKSERVRASRARFFQRVAAEGHPHAAPQARRAPSARRSAEDGVGNPPTGPGPLDSHEFDYPCDIQRRIPWTVSDATHAIPGGTF